MKATIFRMCLNLFPVFLASIHFDTDTKKNRFHPNPINDTFNKIYMADHTGVSKSMLWNKNHFKKTENITIDISMC